MRSAASRAASAACFGTDPATSAPGCAVSRPRRRELGPSGPSRRSDLARVRVHGQPDKTRHLRRVAGAGSVGAGPAVAAAVLDLLRGRHSSGGGGVRRAGSRDEDEHDDEEAQERVETACAMAAVTRPSDAATAATSAVWTSRGTGGDDAGRDGCRRWRCGTTPTVTVVAWIATAMVRSGSGAK